MSPLASKSMLGHFNRNPGLGSLVERPNRPMALDLEYTRDCSSAYRQFMSPGRQRQSIKGKKKKSRECHQCFILVFNIEHIIKLINMIDYKKKEIIF